MLASHLCVPASEADAGEQVCGQNKGGMRWIFEFSLRSVKVIILCRD